MERKGLEIAVCGLDCSECTIFKATTDAEIAWRVADWFRKERGIDVKAEDIRCSGCRGDRTQHWSSDCRILACCVDGKELDFCCECEEFPCDRLEAWAQSGEQYAQALERLRQMKPG